MQRFAKSISEVKETIASFYSTSVNMFGLTAESAECSIWAVSCAIWEKSKIVLGGGDIQNPKEQLGNKSDS